MTHKKPPRRRRHRGHHPQMMPGSGDVDPGSKFLGTATLSDVFQAPKKSAMVFFKGIPRDSRIILRLLFLKLVKGIRKDSKGIPRAWKSEYNGMGLQWKFKDNDILGV